MVTKPLTQTETQVKTEKKSVTSKTVNASSGHNWHLQPSQDVVRDLDVDPASGLSDAEADRRLQSYGRNELVERAGRHPIMLLWDQIIEPLVIILLIAALISALLGKVDSFIAIMAIVVLNAILGVVQEYRAEKAIAALKKMSTPLVRVRRGGQLEDIDAAVLVPGDILMLEAGNIIPADARILEAYNLRVQEASLTGESYPVDKYNKTLEGDNMPIGDRHNMLYMGTSVAYGRGVAVIADTGMKTELGRIADLLQGVGNEKSPLQRRMAELGRVMFAAAFIVMAVAFIVGFVTGDPLDLVLLNAVAIAVAVVPEGLPAVVTISLALGAQRMLRRHALIRKLPAVETLGSVTVIASDKTGTLTENRMTVKVMDVAGHSLDIMNAMQSGIVEDRPQHPSQALLLTSTALCNDASLRFNPSNPTEVITIGDPTEGAMVAAAEHYNFAKADLVQQFPRVNEVPFSSERKRMTTVHEMMEQAVSADKIVTVLNGYIDRYVAFSKGAADSLLDISDRVWVDGKIEPMTDEWRQRIEKANENMARQGLRVLGSTFKPLEHPEEANVESHMIFVGLIGMVDPPRVEVAEAVATCRVAGIRPVMITGDHPMTAHAIAVELGIVSPDERVVTGRDLVGLSDDELREIVRTVSVYARVSPEHKLRIVQALQSNGHVVAMTGDGVNDAPALKQADIGVAMGITGTDVAKEASDMVITDDNFATIVKAAEEGRAIYDNVRRFVKYLLASNTGELFVLLATQLISGLTMPLTTLQILWMNLITDGIPALALGVEKSEKNAMKRAPYLPNESILGRGLGRHILLIGGTLGLVTLGLTIWSFNSGLIALNGAPAWNTMTFMLLTMAQMGHALGLRSHSESLFKMNFFENRLLLLAVVSTLALQLGVVYLPFFNNLFGTNPLTLEQLAICLVLSTSVFWVVELEKLLIRRGILS